MQKLINCVIVPTLMVGGIITCLIIFGLEVKLSKRMSNQNAVISEVAKKVGVQCNVTTNSNWFSKLVGADPVIVIGK